MPLKVASFRALSSARRHASGNRAATPDAPAPRRTGVRALRVAKEVEGEGRLCAEALMKRDEGGGLQGSAMSTQTSRWSDAARAASASGSPGAGQNTPAAVTASPAEGST